LYFLIQSLQQDFIVPLTDIRTKDKQVLPSEVSKKKEVREPLFSLVEQRGLDIFARS
jgi:hypothetical protein